MQGSGIASAFESSPIGHFCCDLSCAVDSNFDQGRPLHIVHEAVDELKSTIIVVIAVLFLGIVICCPNAL